jgi:cytochrome c biogenesis protein CcdA/thiol-disulfide isomerase/thioredoxin
MKYMLFLVLFAFLAGVVTILSPCILPILPIVLSSSVSGGRSRPLGIVTGFIFSFTFFTLALATVVRLTGISADILRTLAIIVVFGFGLSLLIPQTQLLLEKAFTFFTRFVPRNSQKEGFGPGLIVGMSLGLIWSPCVGPILAAVITLAVSNSISLASILITMSYAVGAALPMLVILYSGRQLFQKVPWLLKNTASIQKVFGVIMIATAVAIYFNVDRRLQTYIVEKLPSYGAGLTSLEQNTKVTQELQKLQNEVKLSPTGQLAPDFTGGTHWISSPPLSLKKELKGKVVLVDFWTYSCINCIRTFPYLRDWYQKYKDKGFVIIGVHSPEFEFEKKTENVEQAVKDAHLEYPIVQDNEFAIWRAYDNNSWPAHYLIDKNGYIRHIHSGEGQYMETENAIRELLGEVPLNQKDEQVERKDITPETYLGYERAEGYSYQTKIERDKDKEFEVNAPIEEDSVGLKGKWLISSEYILSSTNVDSILLNFQATHVYLVLSPRGKKNLAATVLLDGKPLPSKYYTPDMDTQGRIIIDQARKYDIIDLKNEYGRHQIEIIFPAGVEAYAFTFGN